MRLTFDAEFGDRPNTGDKTVEILDALELAKETATFFIQGRWALAHPWLVEEIREQGHTIASHGHFHALSSLLTPDGFRQDIHLAGAALGPHAALYRYPFGRVAHDDVLHDLGYKSVLWDVDSQDYNGGTTDKVLERVLHSAETDTILFHTWPDVTPRVIRELLGV